MRNRIILLLFILGINHSVLANNNTLNVYNWSDYMPDDVISQFEKETGININYSTYDSNETMYAKLKADPDAGYDVIVPSSYFVGRMRRQDMLQSFDKSQFPNFKYLNPSLLNKSFDPDNNYSIPYFWGSTAIVTNKQYYTDGSITSWADFWKPQFKNQLLILDDTREVFSMALISLGYSANDTNPDHIKQAYQKLLTLMPNIKVFNQEAAKAMYIDEDATVGMGYSGDIYEANKDNTNLQYIYPKEGFVIWIDCLSIPKGAPHLANAYKFLNFLMRPDIAKKLSMETGYASPNSAAIKLMPLDVQQNYIIYPSQTVLKNGQFEDDVGSASELYEKYLELLKISG
jgi:spermidine/putrescine transport system substrate-binding protein